MLTPFRLYCYTPILHFFDIIVTHLFYTFSTLLLYPMLQFLDFIVAPLSVHLFRHIITPLFYTFSTLLLHPYVTPLSTLLLHP